MWTVWPSEDMPQSVAVSHPQSKKECEDELRLGLEEMPLLLSLARGSIGLGSRGTVR